MKLLLFCLINFVIAAKSQEHGCKQDCPCPDFMSLFQEWGGEIPQYNKEAGCVFNATCSYPHFYSKFDGSPFPEPDDLDGDDYEVYPSANEPQNVFTTFGITCENGEWFASKYPTGIVYAKDLVTFITLGSPGEYDGRKSRIEFFTCAEN